MAIEVARHVLRIMPHKITLMLIGCVALIIGNAGGFWTTLSEIQDTTVEIDKTWAIISNLRSVQSSLAIAESAQRGYRLTGDVEYLNRYRAAKAALSDLLSQLDTMLAGDPRQLESLRRMRAMAAATLKWLSATLALKADNQLEKTAVVARPDIGKKIINAAYGLLATMEADERDKLLARRDLAFQRLRLTAGLGLVFGIITLTILLLFYSHILRNIARRQEAEALFRAATETLEGKVATRTAQLSYLSRHLLQLAENEKAALASELHDELGSNLTAINLDVTSVATQLQSREPKLAKRLNRALAMLHATVDIKRRILQGLRPSMLDSLGLCAAVRMHCEDFTRRTGLPCDTQCPEDFPDVDPSWAIALYRVVQESLTNITKYAQASQVRVSLQFMQEGIRMLVIDDGVGIDGDAITQPMSHGLLGMRERIAQIGGVLLIRPGDDGEGTTIDVFVPFSAKPILS